ncbi:tRNA 2-thiouridine(34) synthase MnmA [bacterium]|nr:MAG: tRNA 2-thiouridine(34) synthase MnmA [bacterium]
MSNKKKQLVFVGLSGGVDSAVAAGLLKKDGYNVVGVFMKCWAPETTTRNNIEEGTEQQNLIGCGWEKDEEDARQVAAKLKIPFYSWDFTKEYRKKVVDYLIDGYKNGITPNPDIECNREIKFGMFLKRALKMGANFVATGHYVRIKACKSRVTDHRLVYKLLKGIDGNKDQSYFLWTLTQEQLKYCLFPVGEYIKPQIRKLAKKWDLPVKDKPDSQGICFIGKVNIEDFLKQYIKSKPGKIRTTDGKIIGEHQGLETYTTGQRRGIRIGGGIPYFVVKKDFDKNELIIGKGRKNEALFKKKLIAIDLNWISGKTPKLPLKCQAKIRYRQPDQKCIIENNENDITTKGSEEEKIKVVFKEKQRAITAGQSVVFYNNDKILGGGVIDTLKIA